MNNLGALEFTAEELMKLGLGPLGKSAKLAEELNSILREKLAKASDLITDPNKH